MNWRKLFDYSQPLVAAATILIVGVFLTALYLGSVAYDIKVAGDTVEVTGSAKESVVADQGRWTISLSTQTTNNDQQAGFDRLSQAVDKISGYLSEQGVEDIETPAGSTYPTYTYPQFGEPVQTGYSVSRDIIVRSNDIELLGSLADNIQPLVGQNYNVITNSLELTYSGLAEARVRLLSEAIADAKARASAIAEDSGRRISTLRNASSGVVQVLPEGGVDVSDMGYYDTQSVKKEVMVTVRANFSLR